MTVQDRTRLTGQLTFPL